SASKFSIAKPIGSIRAWQPAQGGLARCWIMASRMERVVPFSAPSVFSAGTTAGGGGGGDESRFSSTHFPRTTGEVRVAYAVIANKLPCQSTPPRGLSGGKVTFRK